MGLQALADVWVVTLGQCSGQPMMQASPVGRPLKLWSRDQPLIDAAQRLVGAFGTGVDPVNQVCKIIECYVKRSKLCIYDKGYRPL